MFKKLMISLVGALVGFQGIACLQGEIIESNAIAKVFDFVDDDSAVFLNITGTLYEPSTTLADNQWRIYFEERVKAIAVDQSAGRKLVDSIKNQIVLNIPKKAIEETTPLLIENLQKQKIPVLGITQKYMSTTYADNFSEVTSAHLLSLGINLEATLSYLKMPENKIIEDHFSFHHGIVYSNKKPVGPAMTSFLNSIQCHPKKIIMVDNARGSLESAQDAISGSEFIGIRYGLSDARKQHFDPVLGTIEFFAFKNEGKVISDEEALQIKLANPHVNYEALLDNFIRVALK